MFFKLIQGDVFKALPLIESESIDLVVTSPPYWGLRSYGVDGELGAEPTMEAYLNNLMLWVQEVWRVLKPSGSFVLNLGGCYIGGGRGGKYRSETSIMDKQNSTVPSPPNWSEMSGFYKAKQFLDVPAFAYTRIISETDFVCRNRGTWCKPNVPSPIRSRLKQSTESVDWFVKDAGNYYFNPKPWLREITDSSLKRSRRAVLTTRLQGAFASKREYDGAGWLGKHPNQNKLGRELNYPEDKQTIEHSWRVVPVGEKQKGFELEGKGNVKQEHVAPFPEALIKPWIESLTPDKVCKKCGKPVIDKRIVSAVKPDKNTHGVIYGQSRRNKSNIGNPRFFYNTVEKPSCSCNAGFASGIVLDPFLGSGTTMKVCRDLKRSCTGIDLNADYLDYVKKRLNWGSMLGGVEFIEEGGLK